MSSSSSNSGSGSDPNWIENSGMKKGALTSKASKVGMSPMSFAKKNKNAGGRLGKQSTLAITLSKLRNKGALK